jgi:hypothetical protein
LISSRGKILLFHQASTRALVHTQPPIKWVQGGISPGIMHKANCHFYPDSKFRIKWSQNSTLPDKGHVKELWTATLSMKEYSNAMLVTL